MTNFIKNIELPKDDARSASILRTVIRNLKQKQNERENESRTSSSSIQGYANKVYALRQKMFGSNLLASTDSRSASSTTISHSISNAKGPNKVYELRKVMFGSYPS